MKSIMQHSFSRVPTAEIPRSTFERNFSHKTTFDAGLLIPVYWDEVLPGDTFNVNPTAFVRLATPVHPIMDNITMDLHWFFVPDRQIWDNARKFHGEQVNPGDSTDYLIPTWKIGAGGFLEGSIGDYLGLPTKIPDLVFSALPFRALYHIFNEWYRDQNLINTSAFSKGDQVETPVTSVGPFRRGKRHDYFTSCLPFLQKGDAISIPLGTRADVKGLATVQGQAPTAGPLNVLETDQSLISYGAYYAGATANHVIMGHQQIGATDYPLVWADLSNATAATINQLRQSFQIQRLLERDARGGTRYPEIVATHFGVQFPDVTYRPEFLGGGSMMINFHSVPQTSETGATTPQGNLSAFGTGTLQNAGFTKSFVEHGIVMGIMSARADLTYQQGMERKWSRQTRYDFYMPVLAHLGEQAVLNKEIYAQGLSGVDNAVFGYQERWAEYRYAQSRISGLFRSNAAASLDVWHLSQEFSTMPSLNQTFIQEDPPIDRVIALPSEPHFIADIYFQQRCTRPMPVFSVPGLIDHF